MSAGDLLTATWQFEIRATLFGRGHAGVHMPPDLIPGLGNPEPQTADTPLWGQPGTVASTEYDGPRMIVIDAVLLGNVDAELDIVAALNTAWASSPVDIPLALYLPGSSWGKFYVNGRPRGTKPTGRTRTGHLTMSCRFDALDPTIHHL